MLFYLLAWDENPEVWKQDKTLLRGNLNFKAQISPLQKIFSSELDLALCRHADLLMNLLSILFWITVFALFQHLLFFPHTSFVLFVLIQSPFLRSSYQFVLDKCNSYVFLSLLWSLNFFFFFRSVMYLIILGQNMFF